jgi:hypothetical protein
VLTHSLALFICPHKIKEEKTMPDPETPPVETPGQEPVEAPETPPEPPVIPEATPPETPPETPPPEMSPEEKRDHDMRSWIGRRDAEIRAEMERQNQIILNEIQGIKAGPGTPAAEAPDPSVDADAWFIHKTQERENAQIKYNETLVKTGTALLEQDELTRNDPELTQEIFQEIQQGHVVIDRTLAADRAARIALSEAKSNVLTRRILKKTNPLDKNKPVEVPVSGITPPATPPTPPVKLPKMSALATSAAQRWGMTDEEVAKVLTD